MANQLKMANIQAIQSLHAQGWSQRAIARQLGINCETVARYVRPPLGGSNPAKMHAGPGASVENPAQFSEPAQALPAAQAVRPRGCDRWRETIEAQRLAGLSAQRIHQDLVSEHGFTQSYSSVQRYVRLLEAQRPLPFRRMECAPGAEAQVDFGVRAPLIVEGKRRKTHVLRIVLLHSRKAYSEAVERQTTDNFIRVPENAFVHFGGVPQTLVIDNLKAAVTRADWYDPDLNPKLRAFAAHYGVPRTQIARRFRLVVQSGAPLEAAL